MSIKHAILGFLSWSPLTGYDLKKLFANSLTLYWSGNNNQIYRTLVELHQEELVTKEVQPQEQLPSRKVYTITDKGLAELKKWLQSTPELPQMRNAFLTQLTWADQLEQSELNTLIEDYQEELQMHLLMLKEQKRREQANSSAPTRRAYVADLLMERWIAYYENELSWVHTLYQQLNDAPTRQRIEAT